MLHFKKTPERKEVFATAKIRTFGLRLVSKKSENLDKWFSLCLHRAGRWDKREGAILPIIRPSF